MRAFGSRRQCACGSQANAALVDELKRTIEALPLEMNAVSRVAPRLAALDAPSFAVLLKDLARENHAFRLVRPNNQLTEALGSNRHTRPRRLHGDRLFSGCVTACASKNSSRMHSLFETG